LAETLFELALRVPKQSIAFARWYEGLQPPVVTADPVLSDHDSAQDEAILEAALQRMLRRERLATSRKRSRRKPQSEED